MKPWALCVSLAAASSTKSSLQMPRLLRWSTCDIRLRSQLSPILKRITPGFTLPTTMHTRSLTHTRTHTPQHLENSTAAIRSKTEGHRQADSQKIIVHQPIKSSSCCVVSSHFASAWWGRKSRRASLPAPAAMAATSRGVERSMCARCVHPQPSHQQWRLIYVPDCNHVAGEGGAGWGGVGVCVCWGVGG